MKKQLCSEKDCYHTHGYTVGDKIKFPLRLKKSFESRYKAAKQVSGSSDFPHKSRLQLRVKSP